MNWTDIKLIGAVLGGLALALMLSTATTLKARLVTASAGLFCAFFGTDPIVAWAGVPYAADGWPYLIAGCLALSGDRLVRRGMQLIDTIHVPWPWGSNR